MTANTPSPELACSLTDTQMRERRTMARKTLLQYVVDGRLSGRELVLTFSDADGLRSNLDQFVELERGCCGFLSFTISAPGQTLSLKINAPEGAQSTLEAFAAAAGVQ